VFLLRSAFAVSGLSSDSSWKVTPAWGGTGGIVSAAGTQHCADVQLGSYGASFAPPRRAATLGRNFNELEQGTQYHRCWEKKIFRI